MVRLFNPIARIIFQNLMLSFVVNLSNIRKNLIK